MDFPLQSIKETIKEITKSVAILILVDFPLQWVCCDLQIYLNESRNPYFSGFSLAIIMTPQRALKNIGCRNPYFSGFSLAIANTGLAEIP